MPSIFARAHAALRHRIEFTSLVLVLLTGCAGFGLGRDVLTPSLRLVDVQPLAGGTLEQRLRVALVVQNPNDFDIELDGMRLELALNDRLLGRAVSAERIVLPRLEETRLTLDASIGLIDVVRQLLQLNTREALDYQLTGDLFIRSPVDTTLAFDQAGELYAPSAVP